MSKSFRLNEFSSSVLCSSGGQGVLYFLVAMAAISLVLDLKLLCRQLLQLECAGSDSGGGCSNCSGSL